MCEIAGGLIATNRVPLATGRPTRIIYLLCFCFYPAITDIGP